MVVMLARTLDIKGYVQNLPNGKVFIIAEGPKRGPGEICQVHQDR